MAGNPPTFSPLDAAAFPQGDNHGKVLLSSGSSTLMGSLHNPGAGGGPFTFMEDSQNSVKGEANEM